MKAAGTGQSDVVKFLVENGADAGVFDKLDRGLLYLAKHSNGQKKLVHWLLDNAKCSRGIPLEERTPKPNPNKKRPCSAQTIVNWRSAELSGTNVLP